MNKEKLQAAALKYYGTEKSAPQLVAKGSNLTAKKIMEIAAEHEIPVVSSPEIMEVLIKQDVNALIPPELFEIVAEIYAFVFKIQNSNS